MSYRRITIELDGDNTGFDVALQEALTVANDFGLSDNEDLRRTIDGVRVRVAVQSERGGLVRTKKNRQKRQRKADA